MFFSFIDFRERNREVWGRGRETEREILMLERNFNWEPPIHALTGDQTCNLLVIKDDAQPTEPLGQDRLCLFFT